MPQVELARLLIFKYRGAPSSQGVAVNTAIPQTCLHEENCETCFLSSPPSPRTFHKPHSARAPLPLPGSLTSATGTVRPPPALLISLHHPHLLTVLVSRCSASSCAISLILLLVLRGARITFCEGCERRLENTGAGQVWHVKPPSRGSMAGGGRETSGESWRFWHGRTSLVER